ncbi:MAG TPA: hypothetical protein GXX69_06650 [Firmicutes bacterium]|jgi:regulatory protein YycH of two-component signal transduction system YycFG|nr:hypothetical protein [Bacillota bacterium]
MLERIKTVLLFVLVGISLFLSLLIWEGLPVPTTPSSNPPSGGTFWGASLDPLELMVPARIIVHLDEGRHSLLYPDGSLFNRAWRPVLDVLQQLGGRRTEELKLQPADLSQWQEAQKGIGLELVFDFPVDGQMWGYSLGYNQKLSLNWPVKRMIIQTSPEPVLVLASSSGDDFVRLEIPGNSENLATVLEELAGDDLPRYVQLDDTPHAPFGIYIPEQDLSYPLLRMTGEKLQPNVVAGSFFADLSLTRCINERDGATIYSDGRRGVRVWPEGLVEYSAPEVLQGVRLPHTQALSRAIRFVTQHGGWFHNMRLAQLEEVSSGTAQMFYRLGFRQYECGLPVAGFQVELELSDRGVASYRREMLVSERMATKDILSVTELQENLASMVADGVKVTDVYPGYTTEDDHQVVGRLLRPAWLVELQDGQVKVLGPGLPHGGDAK